jgi:hypothetical protein
MTRQKTEQQILRNAALKEIGSRLKGELQPEQDTPDRLRELIVQLEKAISATKSWLTLQQHFSHQKKRRALVWLVRARLKHLSPTATTSACR